VTEGTPEKIADDISRETYVNIMDQCRWPVSASFPEFIKEKPEYHAFLQPEPGKEYADVV
jgi:hypothetical protein